MVFADILNKIKFIRVNLVDIIIRAIENNKEEIADINVDQIESGINAEGQVLGEYASEEYALLKKSLGAKPPTGIVDLKLTGDFLEGVYAEPFKGSSPDDIGIFIDSKDEKTEMLERKYDPVFGIAPQNVDEVSQLLIDDILKQIENEFAKI